MSSVTLIFPHQLFKEHPALQAGRSVVLVEEHLFFSQYHFHRKKIIFHRASMKYYQWYLGQMGYDVEYAERTDIRDLIEELANKGFNNIVLADPSDDWLSRRIRKASAAHGITTEIMRTPYFINKLEDTDEFFRNRKTYFQTDFYTWQRKSRKILVDAAGGPLGGKWSFDAENREKFPKNREAPPFQWARSNQFVVEAQSYCEKHFASSSGSGDHFGYPITFEDAVQWFNEFLHTRFKDFGTYEDAMVKEENFLHHSVLSPLMNAGLLEPQYVISKTLAHASQKNIPLNSLEGFIRQILGWREFIRIVYEREGRMQRTQNHFRFTRKIPSSFWFGTTGIHPVDSVIHHTLQHGYTHHINRLMVMGNFMLLCEFDPNDVYRWFMEMYIDAYDWVMVPNVYGMTQFADGGLMTTKPYISGSNYLVKMGNWEKGPWQKIWDALFWRFMHVHRDLFSKNPRMGMLLSTFDKMAPDKRSGLLQTADDYLARLDHGAASIN
jgi:deoxyribodipyrimidine photolyase-related protein